MKKGINSIKWYIILLLLLISCNEEHVLKPINTGRTPPAAVTGIEVENIPGGAKITYELPQDEELLYVKAKYEIRPGIIREVKSSFYSNSLVVNGFGKSNIFPVTLYTVGRNNVESSPVNITVEPLTPPIVSVFQTLEIAENWGGCTITFENETEANFSIEVFSPDDEGEPEELETFYTSRQNPTFAVRGLNPVEKIIGVVIADEWENRSDTLYKTIVPWFEEEVPKPYVAVDLPGDYTEPHAGTRIDALWDEIYSDQGFLTVPGFGLPQSFTFDINKKTKLSRILYFQRYSGGERFVYNSGAVKDFELYGSNDPNPDGSWDDNWVLLMKGKSIKPSGAALGTYTNEDLEYIQAGEEFLIPNDAPAVRYLRWKTTANWGNASHINIGEITFFGEILE